MKSVSAASLLIAILVHCANPAQAQEVPASRSSGPAEGGKLAALEKMLLGTWFCGPCVGDYTFSADGTFEFKNYTPGDNTLTGTWSLRWDALPPTLVLHCKTSDMKKGAPAQPEYEYLGKTLELKLLELNGDSFAFRFPKDKKAEFPNDKGKRRYERRTEE
jgi:hypothetical protein